MANSKQTRKRCADGYEVHLGTHYISKSGRVCPLCLDEQRYFTFAHGFDFVPVASCPYHDVALIDGSPGDWRH
jgi:hypothetical protein